jgi:hypothetical protein
VAMGTSPQKRSDQETVEFLQKLSEMVCKARDTSNPSTVNDDLRRHIDSEANGILAPALLLWIGDNLLQEARFKEAIEVYKEPVTRYSDRSFGGRPYASFALEQMAACYEQLGEPKDAIDAYRKILDSFPEDTSPAWIHYQMGRIAEEAGNDNEAINAYAEASKAKDEPHHTMVDITDLAQRNSERLKSERKWIQPHPEGLSKLLAHALEVKDTSSLEQLASPTHFTIGAVASERHFINTEKVLSHLLNDLHKSDIQSDSSTLLGSGGKIYLKTKGWKGDLLSDHVLFLLTSTRDGWEWSGIALTQSSEGWKDVVGQIVPGTNQPLPMSIKAPWPAGLQFRAGGIEAAVGSYAAVVLFGPWGMLWDNLFAGPCGRGGGFYYNQPPTHVDVFNNRVLNDSFAIDFARFSQAGVTWISIADGTPVLAVAAGLVTRTEPNRRNGDSVLENFVHIDHTVQTIDFFRLIIELITGTRQPRVTHQFQSHYVHLAGPSMLRVSPMMVVSQGTRLGLMDDTGFSAFSHLHFSIRNVLSGNRSVRPTPMDGQTLNDNEAGKCLSSTNNPI